MLASDQPAAIGSVCVAIDVDARSAQRDQSVSSRELTVAVSIEHRKEGLAERIGRLTFRPRVCVKVAPSVAVDVDEQPVEVGLEPVELGALDEPGSPVMDFAVQDAKVLVVVDHAIVIEINTVARAQVARLIDVKPISSPVSSDRVVIVEPDVVLTARTLTVEVAIGRKQVGASNARRCSFVRYSGA